MTQDKVEVAKLDRLSFDGLRGRLLATSYKKLKALEDHNEGPTLIPNDELEELREKIDACLEVGGIVSGLDQAQGAFLAVLGIEDDETTEPAEPGQIKETEA